MTNEKLETVLHRYSFDVRTEDGRAAGFPFPYEIRCADGRTLSCGTVSEEG